MCASTCKTDSSHCQGSNCLVARVQQRKQGASKKLALSLKDLNTELSKLAESVTASTGIQVDYMLEEGSIFEIIPAVVRRLDARLLVMGTHGIQGMQHITGANILKIAEESPVPDIIVQGKRPNEGGYRTIVFPLDSTRESKQKTFQTAAIARLFNAQVLVFAANESDAFVRQQVNLNIQFAERTFDENQVRYELHYEDVKGPFVCEANYDICRISPS